MYNPYNFYSNPIDRIDNQMRELENLKKNYQNVSPQLPMNVFNVGNTSQIDFEARILNENEKPDEILVQRKTAFIDLFKGELSIKELNGDIKRYDIVLPKTKEQLKIEELERRLREYELSNVNECSTTNEKNVKPTKNDTRATKDSK